MSWGFESQSEEQYCLTNILETRELFCVARNPLWLSLWAILRHIFYCLSIKVNENLFAQNTLMCRMHQFVPINQVSKVKITHLGTLENFASARFALYDWNDFRNSVKTFHHVKAIKVAKVGCIMLQSSTKKTRQSTKVGKAICKSFISTGKGRRGQIYNWCRNAFPVRPQRMMDENETFCIFLRHRSVTTTAASTHVAFDEFSTAVTFPGTSDGQ